jgi:hypothetical protein
MASALFDLLVTADAFLVLRGIGEGEWSIRQPDETDTLMVSLPGAQKEAPLESSLFCGVLRRMAAQLDSPWRVRAELFPSEQDLSKTLQGAFADLLDVILDAGANPWLDPTMFEALVLRPCPSILDRVLAHPAAPPRPWLEETGAVRGRPGTLLEAMAALGNTEGLACLARHGADLRSPGTGGQTLLFQARTPEMVRFLCDAGVNPAHRDGAGQTAATSWTAHDWHTTASLQAMQRTLPKVRSRRGTATREDLLGFMDIALSSNKTKVLGEARRLGVSFDQTLDGKPFGLVLVRTLLERMARKSAEGKGNSYQFALPAAQPATAQWLMEEAFPEGDYGDFSRSTVRHAFAQLCGMASSDGEAAPQTADELSRRLREKAASWSFFDPFFDTLSKNGPPRPEVFVAIRDRLCVLGQSWEGMNPDLWFGKDRDGQCPLFVAWDLLGQWHADVSIRFPGQGFALFSPGLRPGDVKAMDFLGLDHPLWKDPRLPALILSMLPDEGYYYRRGDTNHWGLYPMNPLEACLSRALDTGGHFPAGDALHRAQWEALGDWLAQRAPALLPFHERDMLDQTVGATTHRPARMRL